MRLPEAKARNGVGKMNAWTKFFPDSPRAMRHAASLVLCFVLGTMSASGASAQAIFTVSSHVGLEVSPVPTWSVAVRGVRPGWLAQPCVPIGPGCVGMADLRSVLERQRRFDILRQDPPPAQTGAAAGIWVVPPRRYLPPPTSEDQILPAYRERSVVRPEWSERGFAPPGDKDAGTPVR